MSSLYLRENTLSIFDPFVTTAVCPSSRTDTRFTAFSARNQLKGTVEEILLGGVMTHVVVRVGENLIESVITRRSAEEMALKKGDTVCHDIADREWKN